MLYDDHRQMGAGIVLYRTRLPPMQPRDRAASTCHMRVELVLFSDWFFVWLPGLPPSHKQTFQIQIRSQKVGSITNRCSGNEPAPNQRKSSLSGKCLKLFVGTLKNDPYILSFLPKSNTLGSQTFLAINFREEFCLTVDPQQRVEACP